MKPVLFKVKIKDSKLLAPSLEKGEFLGAKIISNEEGNFVEIDKKSAVRLFTCSLQNEVELVGPDLEIRSGFNTELVKVIKGIGEAEEVVDPLEELTVEELREKATELGLKGIHNAKKDTLIEKIKAEME